jgi:hypothetical protein
MARFNELVPNVPGVEYASCVASIGLGAPSSARSRRSPAARLFPSALSVLGDGLVPIDSQRWGELLREIDADHWAQIGWSTRFDAASFYADLVRQLAARGL